MSDLTTKGFCASAMTFYAVTFAKIREVAREHGYALCLHGSLQRDLDVVAVPWVEEASEEEALIKAIVESSGGFVTSGDPVENKPHGRRGWKIHFGGHAEGAARYIDLSVMQKVRQP